MYNGGYFKGQMRFPADFPFSPPTFRFTPAIYHPNVYRDGRLCISILHQGGDPTADEPDLETWSPAQTVELVLISIISLLEDPNPSSAANVDAGIDLRKNPDAYKKKVLQEVERLKKDIPEDFVIPDLEHSAYGSSYSKIGYDEPEPVDEDFWYESEGDDDDDEVESFDEESLMDDNMEDDDDDVEDEEENSDINIIVGK